MGFPSCRGTVVVSPTKSFTIFNNTTAFSSLAATKEGSKRLPCLLEDMLFSKYEALAQGALGPMHFDREYYYFQGSLPPKSLRYVGQSIPFKCSGE